VITKQVNLGKAPNPVEPVQHRSNFHLRSLPLPLAPLQQASFSQWLSLTDILPDTPVDLKSLLPADITQDVVTDCSLVAGLQVCLQHRIKFGSNVRAFMPAHLNSGFTPSRHTARSLCSTSPVERWTPHAEHYGPLPCPDFVQRCSSSGNQNFLSARLYLLI
jgi:hypothetical protein